MSWGIVAGAAIGAVGSAVSSESAGDAANSQANATANANSMSMNQWLGMAGNLEPFRYNGANAANRLAMYLGTGGEQQSDYGWLLKQFDGGNLQNDPGYQFGLNEGMKALDRRMQNSGNYFSGAALKGAQRYAQDYAGTKFNDAFNRDSARKTQAYNFLSGQASLGENAGAMVGNAGMNMAGQVGANTVAMGNAMGASQIAQGNAWTNGLNNAVSQYQQNELLKKLNTPSAPSSSSGWGSGWSGDGWGTGNAYGNQDYGQYF